MDFNSLVLPRENFWRAQATQKEIKPAEEISNDVEHELAKLFQKEFDFLETYERLKV